FDSVVFCRDFLGAWRWIGYEVGEGEGAWARASGCACANVVRKVSALQFVHVSGVLRGDVYRRPLCLKYFLPRFEPLADLSACRARDPVHVPQMLQDGAAHFRDCPRYELDFPFWIELVDGLYQGVEGGAGEVVSVDVSAELATAGDGACGDRGEVLVRLDEPGSGAVARHGVGIVVECVPEAVHGGVWGCHRLASAMRQSCHALLCAE